jgi:hypothetical protein
MDMKRTAKKIAALVAGSTMIGATIVGATALDLSNYPAPFVTNGVFSGKIVVGAEAASSDVVGAIDIAASLQAAATSESEVNVPGAAGTATVQGDSAEFRTGSDIVSFEEQLGTVKQTFTASDLDALKSGVLDTGSSSTPVKQYLKFDSTTMRVVYDEDSDNDKLGDYLYVPDSSQLFEYQLEFTEGAESDVDADGSLEDLENEVLTILGAPFTIVTADRSVNTLDLTLLGGQVADVLRDGETKTYKIDGVDYEVTGVFISEDGTAKLSVNGVMTKELDEGDTEVLGNDVTVGVQSVLTNHREGLVEFFLGANKIELSDSNYENTAYNSQGTVEVRGETVDNVQLILKATNVTSSKVKLNYIKYNVTADDEYYVPAGAGVKAVIEDDNEGAFLTDTWDIWYTGLVKTSSAPIVVDAVSDHSYELEFTNVNGDKFTVPLVTNKNGAFRWGDEDDDLVFTESAVAGSTNWNTNGTTVSDNDYFVVSDKSTATDDKAATKVLRYQSLNTGDSTATFKDLSGSDIVVSYTGTPGTDATGQLIVDGVTHQFWVGASGSGEEDYALRIDLDGNAAITDGDEVPLVTWGGAIVNLRFNGTSDQAFAADGSGVRDMGSADVVRINVTTNADRFDESSNDETSRADIAPGSSNDVDFTGTVVVGGSSANLVSDPDNDDYDRGYSSYGAFFELYNPSSGDDSDELTIDYPGAQRYPQVFVTAGTVDVADSEMGESGSLMTEQVNPIAVGLAVLDTDAPALGSAKLIVVGGPCVNTVAAELMGNPTSCAEGFTPGKAVIKFYASQNALLVAGYGAQDTLGAAYVLADASDYKLTGNEVEVVVADLNTLTVNKVN